MVPVVRNGLLGQVAVLAVLAGTTGLGVAGWLVGLGYGLVLSALLTRGLRGARPGPADRVTLTRATLVGGVTALAVDRPPGPLLVGLTAVALALDAVDGRVARRTGTASVLGARFDMEVDAFLILVLSALAGPVWALAMGGMRYAWVAAGWGLRWLPGPLPPRYWRKVVAAVQGVVLLVATADVLPGPVETAALLGALALLTESFGRDVVWRWPYRHHDHRRSVVAVPIG